VSLLHIKREILLYPAPVIGQAPDDNIAGAFYVGSEQFNSYFITGSDLTQRLKQEGGLGQRDVRVILKRGYPCPLGFI
jgi:hypothetical protein